MKIGSLGDIIFEVSEDTIRTIRNASWSGSARLAEHQRHLQKSLVEFCGSDPDAITFSIQLSAYLGTDPKEYIKKLVAYEKNGTAVVLVLGAVKYGEYRWLIDKHKVNMDNYDGAGNLTSADVSVTLKEYIKE